MRSTDEIVYAFIDSQNLYLGVKSLGWELDFKKFRIYLRNKYGVESAYIFLGYIKEYENIYEMLRRCGYKIIFKPTIKYRKGSSYTVKGNVDIELALQVMIEINNFDKCIIVSGDGDFYSLIKYLYDMDRLYKVIVPNNQYSTLLKRFSKYIVTLENSRDNLCK